MTGRNLEGQYAGFLSRAVGLILDYAIVSAVVVLTGLLTMLIFRSFNINLNSCSGDIAFTSISDLACLAGRGFLVLFTLVFGPLYYLVFWMLTGQTVGQRVMGLRVIRLNGRRVGFFASLLRWLGYQLCLATFGLGFLWVLIDNRRMGWHDKLARTCVIYAWPAEQNEAFIAKMNRRFGRTNAPPVPAQVKSDSAQSGSISQESRAG